LYAFVGLIVSRPYRRFSILVLQTRSQKTTNHFSSMERLDVAAFLWWRQMVAGAIARALAVLLNLLLGATGANAMMGIGVAAGVLVVGPILLKMLIGHPFGDFMLVAKRRDGAVR
jgi:hypothetical protein